MRTIAAIVVAGYTAASSVMAQSASGASTNAARGKLRCGLTAWDPATGDVAEPGSLVAGSALEIEIWNDAEARVSIRRGMVDSIGGRPRRNAGDGGEGHYLRFRGESITTENDAVVARFRDNTPVGPGAGSPNFAGFKVHLGRHVESEAGRELEVDVYFRIILDWSYRSPRYGDMSVHRAAFVVSEVPAGIEAHRERFYRFLPNRRPFQMMACALADAEPA